MQTHSVPKTVATTRTALRVQRGSLWRCARRETALPRLSHPAHWESTDGVASPGPDDRRASEPRTLWSTSATSRLRYGLLRLAWNPKRVGSDITGSSA